MKNSQKGSVSLLALLIASFLLSLGGGGAAAAYFQKNPNDFMKELRSYLTANLGATNLAPLDTTPTPTDTVTPTDTITPSATPTPAPTGTITPTPTVTPTPIPSVTVGGEDGEDESQEEIHESSTAKIHEHESETKVHGHAEVEVSDRDE